MPKFNSVISVAAGGTASLPAIAIIGDATSGLYQPTSGQIALTAGGVQGALFTSTSATFPLASTFSLALTATGGIKGLPSGTTTLPALGFSNSTNTGIYSPSTGVVSFVAGGTQITSASSTQFSIGSSIAFNAGAATFTGALNAQDGITVTNTGGLSVSAGGITLNASSGGLSIGSSNTISMGSNVINNVGTPLVSTDAANMAYVQAVAQGLDVHASSQWSTNSLTVSVTISVGYVTQISGTTLDGGSPAVNDRILITNAPATTGSTSNTSYTAQPANGIYTVTSNTTNLSLARATDLSGYNGPAGAFTFVEEGTANTGAGFVVIVPTNNTGFTYGTSNIQWTQFSGAGSITAGTGLSKSGNTISLTTPVAVSNGGLGAAPTLANGTILVASSSSVVGGLANGTSGLPLIAGASTPAYGQLNIASGTNVTGVLAVTNGGLGASPTLANGSILVATSTTAVGVLANGTSGLPLLAGASTPSYGALSLSGSAVTGTLPVLQGGTGQTTIAGIITALHSASVYSTTWSPSGSVNYVTFTPSISPATAGVWSVTIINTTNYASTGNVIEYGDVTISNSGAITVTFTSNPTSGTTYTIQCVG